MSRLNVWPSWFARKLVLVQSLSVYAWVRPFRPSCPPHGCLQSPGRGPFRGQLHLMRDVAVKYSCDSQGHFQNLAHGAVARLLCGGALGSAFLVGGRWRSSGGAVWTSGTSALASLMVGLPPRTRRAMGGAVPFKAALTERLALIRPSREQVQRLIAEHPPHLTPGIR